jgi:hypothetical protein
LVTPKLSTSSYLFSGSEATQIVVLMTTMTPVAGCHEHSLRYVPTSFSPMSKAVYSLPATAPTNKPLTTRYRCVHAFFNRESWYSFTKDFVLRFF